MVSNKRARAMPDNQLRSPVSLGNGGLFFCSSVLPGGPQAGRLKWSRYSTYWHILTLLSVLIFVSFIDCSALEGSIMILWYAYNKKKKSTVINERFTSVFVLYGAVTWWQTHRHNKDDLLFLKKGIFLSLKITITQPFLYQKSWIFLWGVLNLLSYGPSADFKSDP